MAEELGGRGEDGGEEDGGTFDPVKGVVWYQRCRGETYMLGLV